MFAKTRRELTENDLKLIGLPRRYWPVDESGFGLDIERVSAGRHKDAVKNYISKLPEMLDNGHGMMLYGKFGSGKTALAAMICHEARRIDALVCFVRSYELKDAIINRRMWDDGISVDDRVKRVDLLVIDDLGKEHSPSTSGWNEMYFEELLRARSDRMKSTILTSNFSPDTMKTMYKDSMIAVMKGCIWPILVDGMDFREIEQKELKKEFK